jgi:hypothetical protein
MAFAFLNKSRSSHIDQVKGLYLTVAFTGDRASVSKSVFPSHSEYLEKRNVILSFYLYHLPGT